MSEIFLRIVNLSYSAIWIVLAVVLLRLVLRKAPKWLHVLLWALVAVRLVLPFSIESRLSLQPSAQVISPSAVQTGMPNIHTGMAALNYMVADNQNYVNKAVDWVPVLAAVWLAGLAVMLLYAVVSYWRLKRQLKPLNIFNDGVFTCENLSFSFILGVFRPFVYVPNTVSEAELPYILAHEQAHIQRKDHIWKPLGYILLSFHWFNPVLWLAYLLLCRDIELACDEKVVRELQPMERADYSQTILNCGITRRQIAACPLAFGGVGAKTRIKTVLSYKRPGFWIILLAVLALLTTAVCLLTVPRSVNDVPLQNWFTPAELLYQSGTAGLSADVRVTEENHLMLGVQSGDLIWNDLGELAPYTLTKAELKDYTAYRDGWLKRNSIGTITESWILRLPEQNGNHMFYLLFRGQWGDLYLSYGWEDVSERGQEGSDDTHLFWVYRLRVSELADELSSSLLNAPMVWVDFLDDPEEMGNVYDVTATLPEYDSVEFRYTSGEIRAVRENDEQVLLQGMPIWNAFFFDLNGDGMREICATVSFGSGIVDTHVVVVDCWHNELYTLWERGEYDYRLRLVDGVLYCEQRVYPMGELVNSGPLALAATSFRPWTLMIGDPVMVPTEAKITGVYDGYLYLKGKDGKKYRYERADVYGETLTKGKLIDSFTELAEPENVKWEIYEFEEIPSRYSVLAVVDGLFQIRYDHAPPKALHSSILPQMKTDGMIVAEDGVLTNGLEEWREFYESTGDGQPGTILFVQYHTLQKEHCSAEYYEAYKEDYPYLVNMELSYDRGAYRLHWWENNVEYERVYGYLKREETETASTVDHAEPETTIRYYLTEDPDATWMELLMESVSSSYMAGRTEWFTLFSE